MSSPSRTDPAAGDLVAGLPSSVLASVDFPEPFGPIRAWSSPGADGEGHAAEDLAAVDARRGGRRSRGQAGGIRGRGGIVHAGHFNNTTDVVEIPTGRFTGDTRRVDGLVAAHHGRGREALLDPGPAGRRDRDRRRGRSRATRSSAPSRRKPVTPSATSSGAAPQFVVTTGVPHAMASTMTRPNGSGQRIGNSMRTRAAEQLDLLLVRHVLEELDVVAEQRLDLVLEVRALRRLAALQDHLQRAAGLPRDADRLHRSLVGVRAPDVDEELVLLRRGTGTRRVDAVVHDRPRT